MHARSHRPGWRAEYTGTDPGNVGSGELLVTVCHLYRAGRNERLESPRFTVSSPDAPRRCEHAAIFDLPLGDGDSHQRCWSCGTKHDVLRQTSLRGGGAALVATADDYA